jgi:hypothetical protein
MGRETGASLAKDQWVLMSKARPMPTHQRLGMDDRKSLQNRRKQSVQPHSSPMFMSLCALWVKPGAICGAFLGYFGTVWLGPRENHTNRDYVAVLRGCSERVSATKIP